MAEPETQIHMYPRSNIALAKKFIWVSWDMSWTNQNELFGQPNTMIVSWLFPIFPAVETTGDSNNNHIKHNFTLLEGPFPGSFFNPITNWDT